MVKTVKQTSSFSCIYYHTKNHLIYRLHEKTADGKYIFAGGCDYIIDANTTVIRTEPVGKIVFTRLRRIDNPEEHLDVLELKKNYKAWWQVRSDDPRYASSSRYWDPI